MEIMRSESSKGGFVRDIGFVFWGLLRGEPHGFVYRLRKNKEI